MAADRPTWKIRRRIIVSTLIFCAYVVLHCLNTIEEATQNSRIIETALTSAFALAGWIIGAYVFGAVWQDTAKNKKVDE